MTNDDWELENWTWPYARINTSGAKEYACPHGVGHGGIHGCDGCCRNKSYGKQAIIREILNEKRKRQKKKSKRKTR